MTVMEKVRFFLSNQKGQALVVVSLLILVAFMVVGITVDVGELVIRNIKLQNAADAGAYRGAEAIALALNTVALGNATIEALGILALFTKGSTFEALRAVQMAQDVIIQTTPAISVATAVLVATGFNDADLAVPLNRLNSDETLPSLMVKRAYLLPILFGNRFPLWIDDAYRSSKQKPYGDRFLRLGVMGSSQKTPFIGKLLGKNLSIPVTYAVAEAYVSGGSVLPPFPKWTYKAKLTQVTVKVSFDF